MAVIPLLPIFVKFNRLFFENSLIINQEPIVKLKWSDNRLKTTAGIYKRKTIKGIIISEIILSKPILANLSLNEIHSTLCHEMIHAWVDRILKINEIHGPNFLSKMNEINKKEDAFQISVRHNFPVERKDDYPVIRNALKFKGKCIYCGQIFMYRKRVKNLACKKCCITFFNGAWNKNCLIKFED